MRKVFFGNLILLLVLNVLIKPFYILGIDASVQNRVGAEAYGNYFSLLNFSFLFSILLDVGLTNYNTRNIAQSPQTLAKNLGSIIGIKLLLFIFFSLFTLCFGLVIGYSSMQMELLGILVLNQFFTSMLLYFRSNFSGLHRFKTDAFFSILDRLLLILICSVLLWGHWFSGEFKITWFVWAQTISYGIAALLAGMLSLKLSGFPKISFQKKFSLAILKQSFPYALLILLMSLYNRTDSVMIERLLPDGKKSAGIYAQGYRLLDAANMFALLFAGLLFPIFSRLLKEKQNLRNLVSSSATTLITCATIVSISCYFYAYDLIAWRYNDNLIYAAPTFSILILSFVPVSITYIYGTLLTANGDLKLLNQMALGGLVANLALNFWLIPLYGSWGAAVATLSTQSVTALLQLVIALQKTPIQVNTKAVIKFSIFSLIALPVCYCLHIYFNGINGFLLTFSACVVIALLTDALSLKEGLKALKIRYT